MSKYAQLSSSLSKEPILCIAMHPMGLQLVAGYSEKYRIFYLLEGEVREAVDFPAKKCYAVAYSHGGQYLAVANWNVVQIIDPYTFDIMYSLHGHPQPVKVLSWNESDSILVSAGGGTAYGWSSNFEIYQKDSKVARKKQSDESVQGMNRIEVIVKNQTINAI